MGFYCINVLLLDFRLGDDKPFLGRDRDMVCQKFPEGDLSPCCNGPDRKPYIIRVQGISLFTQRPEFMNQGLCLASRCFITLNKNLASPCTDSNTERLLDQLKILG